MSTPFKRLTVHTAALAALLAFTVEGARAESSDPPEGLTGTWTMSLIGDHVIPLGLALKQDGAALTGTLTMMGKDVPIKGELKNGALTFTGAATMMMRDHATGAESGAPASSVPQMKFIGVVQPDGTLAGEMAAPRGPMKWTADRLKERAVTAATAPQDSGALATFAGSWNVSVIADHVTPVGLLIQTEGGGAKGTLTLMGSDVPLAAEFSGGVLTFTGEFTAEVSARSGMKGALKVTAKMKDDGSIEGEFSMAHGTFPLTGERLKNR